jgi:hypothetical protein
MAESRTLLAVLIAPAQNMLAAQVLCRLSTKLRIEHFLLGVLAELILIMCYRLAMPFEGFVVITVDSSFPDDLVM